MQNITGPAWLRWALGTNMTASMEQKVLRPAWVVVLFLGSLLIFLLLGAWLFHALGNKWIPPFFIVPGLLNAVGLVSHLASRIVLLPDRIEFRTLLGKRRIFKEQIKSITWVKGGGVRVQTKEQKWIRIPDLGRAQGVCNSVRAWLKRDNPVA